MPLQQIAVLSPQHLVQDLQAQHPGIMSSPPVAPSEDGSGAGPEPMDNSSGAGQEPMDNSNGGGQEPMAADNPQPRDTEESADMGATDTKAAATVTGKNSKKEKITPKKRKDRVTQETLHPDSPTPISVDRCDSSLSSNSMEVCRICQCDSCEIQSDSPLVAPCLCSGSMKFIHQACLQKWIKSSDKQSCELCQFEYHMTKKTKSFRQWERLEMTPAERRKVVCSVTFHVIAITCVIWSLYVLIDRTTDEVKTGSLLWPFWTKLIVVAIGFTGGVVFMYVQCKMYLALCKRWRMYNKVILIETLSESEREKVKRAGLLKVKGKERQLSEGIGGGGGGGGTAPNLAVFNVVNETAAV